MGGFVIRPAEKKDLREVVEIENLCFPEEPFSQRQLSYLLCKAKGWFYVAEVDNKCVGYVSLLTRKNTHYARFYSFAVNPQFQKMGIGEGLFTHALKIVSAQEQINTVGLEVRTDNIYARKFYEKIGFFQTSIKRAYYGDGMDAICMHMSL
ncbi:MAG: ribosomal protein S18-alanine N-acetyltransferase [Bacteroidaceae bacterium]